MLIKTKFELGQEVWVMMNNRPIKLFIHIIKITAGLNNDKKVIYGIEYNLGNGSQGGNFREDAIHATKEDLKNSIFK